MKILFVTNLYGDLARGGAERVVEDEATALAELGHDVVVVSGEPKRHIPKGVCLPGEPWLCPPPGTREEVATAYGAAVKRASVKGKPRLIRYHPPNFYFYSDDHKHGFLTRFLWHLRDMHNGRSATVLRTILELEKPDVVHTHNLMGLGFRIPDLLRSLRIRHVHTVHDVQLLHPSGLLPPNSSPLRNFATPQLPRIAYAAMMRRLMGSPETVIFPSEFLRDEHVRRKFFAGSRLDIVRNPAPEVSVAARPEPATPRFLFAGQLERHKGVGFLLDVWSRWEDKGDAELEIAGTGTLEKELKRRVKKLKSVRLLGKLERFAMLKAYARSAYLVFPSLVIENAPSSIMESLSRGTPIVAAAVGGVPELVAEGQTGYLFRPGDAKDCLAALRRAAAGLAEWSSFFERCMKKAQEWSLENHVENIVRIYGEKSEKRKEKSSA